MVLKMSAAVGACRVRLRAMHLIDPVDQLGYPDTVFLHGFPAKQSSSVAAPVWYGNLCTTLPCHWVIGSHPCADSEVALACRIPSCNADPTCCMIRFTLHQGLSDPARANQRSWAWQMKNRK